ncbi:MULTISPECIES: diguanylate cyclase domain-containing protein [unclassified Caballeronia]|uniref:GGDEF domain-containing protein n=1 Tax=unclassified Caballeronia TaxID=2646786 RepID=UPI002857A991|nr:MULTISPECIES: diguanylate cyclase [unclassified Caballeronia]MDR5776793.1 diguanylate cyclase [Caballeronia sp. LZ002]MDR5798651.1 diguanylate cyclase [Caballeronia sp. LZ001]MDR5852233.1 diguanylate cyclase [Caballeronia sp. LZ003]
MKLLSKVSAISVAFAIAASFGIALTHATWGVSSIWPANGLIVGMLFQRRKTPWREMIGAVAIGGVAANLWLHIDAATAFIFASGNVVEVAILSVVLGGHFAPVSPVVHPKGLYQFLALAVLAPAAVAGALIGLLSHVLLSWPALTIALTWLRSDALGLAVFLPIGYMARRAFRGQIHRCIWNSTRRRCARGLLAHGIVLAVSASIFAPKHLISPYWALPSIVLAVLWAGGYAAITGTFITAAFAVVTTVNHPVQSTFGSFRFPTGAILEVQGFTLACTVASYLMAAVLSDRQRFFRQATRGHKKQLELAASLLAVNEELKVLARLDPLTGLANRRSFDGSLSDALAKARAGASAIGVMFVDIDWFKRYNDRYGHGKGDDALAEVARALRTVFPEGSSIARLGGEEFAVIVPEGDAAALVELATAAVQRIYDLSILHGDSPYGCLTISVGVATSSVPPTDDGAQLLRQADAAMYRAKRDGRNGYATHLE